MIALSLASLVVRVAGEAASFGFQVLLARLLGSAHLGTYHTANTASDAPKRSAFMPSCRASHCSLR